MNPNKTILANCEKRPAKTDAFDLYRSGDDRYFVIVKSSDEGQFEQNFFQLAFTYVRDKIPNLLDYMLGFEVTERNDEGTKATGLFKFDVNGRTLYVPVFYNNGELKGAELLYMADQDLFIPNDESWVDFIMNRRPAELGEPADRNTQSYNFQEPNLRELYTTDSSKLATHTNSLIGLTGLSRITGDTDEDQEDGDLELDEEPEDGTPEEYSRGSSPDKKEDVDYLDQEKVSELLEKMTSLGPGPSWGNLITFINNNGSKTATVLAKTLRDYPELHRVAYDFYGNDLYTALENVKKSVTDSWPAIEKDLPKVQVFTNSMDTGLKDILNEDELEALINDGIAFVDRRIQDEKSIAYTVETTISLSSPNQPGIYDLLCKGGVFKKVAILPIEDGPSVMRSGYLGGPYDMRKPKDYRKVFVINIDENHVSIEPQSDLLVRSSYTPETFRDWVNSLPSVTTMTKVEPDRSYKGYKEGDKLTKYIIIDPETFTAFGQVELHNRITNNGVTELNIYSYPSEGLPVEHVVISNRNNGMSRRGNTLYLNPSVKAYAKTESVYSTASKNRIVPGTQDDLDLLVRREFDKIKVSSLDLGEYIIRDNNDHVIKCSHFRDVLRHLICNRGLDYATSRKILDSTDKNSTFDVYIKYAQGAAGEMLYPPMPDPRMSFDPRLGIPQIQPQQESFPAMAASGPDITTQNIMAGATGMRGDDTGIHNNDNYATLNPDSVQGIMQAAQTGDRNTFDTGMISQLLQSSDIDHMLLKYIDDFNKALDRLGRLYFLMLWHGDKFAERFGAEDLPELESLVRTTFQNIGELTLKLKERRIDSDSGAAVELDLNTLI